jgi:hypothetical protein
VLLTWIGLPLAFASALVTNTAYSLEHDAAAALPPLSPLRPFRLAELLLHDRRWVTGFAAYAAGTSVLQSAYQRGDALTAAGTATIMTNAVPIAAGFVLFGEMLPHGIRAVLQLAAFACLVLSAVALGRQRSPGPEPR